MSHELTPAHGGNQWYQWDHGQSITILDDEIDQVHIYNPDREEATVIDVVDGEAEIPDRYLQQAGQLRVYAFTTAEGRTIGVDAWKVIDRQKPEDYPYVPAEEISAGIIIGSPLTARTAAEMKNKSRVYVYTGSETGYTNGNWYYWDGSDWSSGGVYNSTALETDPSLTQAGSAADAAAAGRLISYSSVCILGGAANVPLEQGSFRFSSNAIVWQNNANRCRTRQGTYLQLYKGDVITATNGVLVSCVRVDSDFNKIEIIGEQQYNTSITVEIPGRHLLLLHYDGDSPALTPATAMQNCTLTSAGLAGDIQGLMIEEGATYE